MTDERHRLDVEMLRQGLTESRSRARMLIVSGKVLVNGRVETKSGRPVEHSDRVEVTEHLRYVSRGGMKLAHALECFSIHPAGWSVVDIGSSTGGFTECWLEHGATRVFAVDVGFDQLHPKLREDARVVVMERTNARYLTPDLFGDALPLDGASLDASFIGLTLLLPALRGLLAPSASVVALVKPQFEAGPEQVGKHGVVKSAEVQQAVLRRVAAQARELDYSVRGLTASPVRGPEGNIEFLLHLEAGAGRDEAVDIPAVVQQAWKAGDGDF